MSEIRGRTHLRGMFTAGSKPPLSALSGTFLTDSNIADDFHRGRQKNLLTLTAGELNSERLPKEKILNRNASTLHIRAFFIRTFFTFCALT